MTNKVYEAVAVLPNVYVSSDTSYHFEVLIYRTDGKRRRDWYTLGFGFNDWSRSPQYIESMTMKAILDLIKSDGAKYYEKDRDGFSRYDNYRYHSEEEVARNIEYCEGWFTR